jgi:FAD/FMN-containing dehydrogenase
MWNLKTADVITDYKSAWYSGPAMKIGSGITAGEAETVAYQSGYRVVGGECGSVGIAGGYSQGGGHSMLSTEYGMAADQVLEWEVVTASGKHLIATPQQNADLYWALSGGGAGNYGVVLSMTSRIFKDGPMAGGSLSFANTNETSYWEAVSRWFQRTPSLAGENNTIIFLVTRDAFEAVAMTLPGQLPSAVETLLSQYLNDLKQLNITYALSTTHSDSYYDHFNAYFGPLPWGIESPATFVQNRIIPKEIVESPSATAKLMDAFRTTVADGTFFPGCLVANVSNSNYTDNAVLPAWRDTAVSCNLNAYWNYSAPMADNLALKKDMSEIYQPLIEAATPGGGVYANEMDPWYKGDWKTNIYGSAKYKRLLKIKHTYDPSHVFWAIFAVGSDELVLDGSGRLCPVGSG